MAIYRMSGLLEFAFVEQTDQRAKFVREARVILRRERGVSDRMDAKDIHDLFAVQAGTHLGPLARALSVPRPR